MFSCGIYLSNHEMDMNDYPQNQHFLCTKHLHRTISHSYEKGNSPEHGVPWTATPTRYAHHFFIARLPSAKIRASQRSVLRVFSPEGILPTPRLLPRNPLPREPAHKGLGGSLSQCDQPTENSAFGTGGGPRGCPADVAGVWRHYKHGAPAPSVWRETVARERKHRIYVRTRF